MKRALAFVLLLVLGFVLLRLALGGEQFATAGGGDRPRARTDAPVGDPIRVQKDGTELQVRGGFTIAPQRRVPLDDGATAFQPVYELTCADSAPADGTRHRLDDVAMKLFDRGDHIADLLASRAVVELDVDEQRRRSLRENKELMLDDAVFVTVPGSRLAPMRIEVGRVRARFDDDVIALDTPDENAPVRVVVDGDRRGELTGRGLRARMPRDRSAALGRLDLLILHEPVLTMAGVGLTASGQLHYVEQLASGAALLTVDGDVRVDLVGALRTVPVTVTGPTPPGGSGGIAVRGDRLHGWLQRSQKRSTATATAGDQALLWTMLRLLGSRAKVTTADLELASPRLTVLPGPTGEMASVTADGGPSELRRFARSEGMGGGATFRSPRPIHLVRTGAWSGAVYRRFGFPAFALGPLMDLEVVTFDGSSEVDAGDGVRVAADRGLHLFRQPTSAPAGTFVARGFGNVVIARSGSGGATSSQTSSSDDVIEARGDSGFVLWRRQSGDEIVLGHDDPAAVQQFTLVRGALQLHGNGACRIERAGDGPIPGLVRLRLRSDRPTIGGTFVASERGDPTIGRLRGARSLDVDVGDREVLRLLATGAETTVEFTGDGRRLLATAERVEQTSPNSWRLSGPIESPARFLLPTDASGRNGDLTAPRIDLHRIAARSLLVDATAMGGVPARLHARLRRGNAAPATIVATANRVRLLPFAIGPAALPRQLLGLSPALTQVVAASIASPWLQAVGDVVCDVTDPTRGDLHGEGQLLAASQGAHALLFQGDASQNLPARLERLEHGERTVAAEGPRLRVVADGDGERITVLTTFPGQTQLVPPRVTFRGAPANPERGDGDDGRLGWIRGECRGEVEVRPEAVLFRGPVTATSLLADASEDPLGMHITAQQMQMDRLRDTGELVRVLADGGVVVDWRQMRAISKRVELDLRWQRCIAEDPNGAEVRFGERSYRAPRLEANYATYAVRSYRGRLVNEAEPTARR